MEHYLKTEISTLRFLINILLVLACIAAQAQQDSVRNKFLPTGIRVGVDAISIVRSQVNDNFSGYEFQADVDFYRYFLVVEAGQWERNFDNETDAYKNNGRYMRIGADVNFLLKDEDRNVFFIGARYGFGTFSETLTQQFSDPVWGVINQNFQNDDVQASWLELTGGLKVKMFSFLWMGYTARYKFGLSTRGNNQLTSHDVPGYGATDKNSTWGFNYYLMFRIPVRKS